MKLREQPGNKAAANVNGSSSSTIDTSDIPILPEIDVSFSEGYSVVVFTACQLAFLHVLLLLGSLFHAITSGHPLVAACLLFTMVFHIERAMSREPCAQT